MVIRRIKYKRYPEKQGKSGKISLYLIRVTILEEKMTAPS
jgi:hypothetical protein